MQTDGGQNWLAHKVTEKLSNNLKSRISIQHVNFGFFNKMNLEGVLLEDQRKDTLLSAEVVQVRITDWFFFKEKADLNYIGIKNAVINVNRRDSIWNYQYLVNYFAPPTNSAKKSAGIEFNLKKVLLENVAFVQKDAWLGSDLYAKVESLNLDANNMSFSGKNIDIKNLDLVKPFFQLYDYTGLKPLTEMVNVPATNKDSSTGWNPGHWTILFNKIKITDGVFKNDQGTLIPATSYFDGQHIAFSNINGSINNLHLINDTLQASIDLATRERSGLNAQKLRAELRIHPQLMEFSKLYLKTDRSELKDYFAMKYPSLASMSNFIHAVTMEANFTNSTLSSDDIAYFAPSIKDWNRNLKMDGNITGTVDALAGEGVHLQVGNNTSLDGNFTILGLPDIQKAFINVEAHDLRTTYADAVTLVPSIKKVQGVNLRKLSSLRFNGTYTGFINDFVAYGTVQTGLGTLVTDLNMKLPKGADPIYSGSIATTGFQLGQLFNNSQLGVVAFNGDIKGKSFAWNRLDMKVDGTIKKFYFNGYTYQNIIANGVLKNRLFNGKFDSKDPNATLQLTGLIDLSGSRPLVNAQSKIEYLNLEALHFSPTPFTLTGDFDLSFNGKTLSDFLGRAAISNATLLYNGKQLTFDSLIVSNTFDNGIRSLRARSNEFDAIVTGNFDLKSLPDAFTVFLSRYYPSYINPPSRFIPSQAFTFDITTGVVEDYMQALVPHLSGFNNSHISGSLNVAANILKLDADIPHISYNQYEFSDVMLKGDGNFERLIVTGQVNDSRITDSLNFPQTNFSITASNDVSDITLSTSANQTINQAALSAEIKTFSNGASVSFKPSSFVLNGKTWNLEQGGELDFRKNSSVQGQLVLKESQQEVRISTQPSDIGSWIDLNVALQNINIGDFSPFFLKENRLEGLLTGNIHIEDPQKKFNVTGYFKTDQLRMDNDSIGQVQANLGYNNTTGLLTGNGGNFDPLHKLNFDLALDFKDSANTHQDRISVAAVNYEAKILERFLGTLFSNITGYVTGNMDILGEGANRDFIAKAKLKDVGLKVLFTQVAYKLDDTEIELTKDEIKLGTLKLRDENNRTATVQGTIKHNSFKNMYFDIVAEVDNQPMLLLNTTYSDNQQFYGRAKGTGSLILVGPQNDMFMQINAKASESDSSFITLPPSRNRASGMASFMVERKYGREMSNEDYSGSASNITYEVDLTANPLVNIEVILDELTGDIIKGRGVGNLRMRAGTSEPLTMRGRYDIEDGSYLFTFQSFFKKPFEIRKGSNNYIEWTGDPYTAQIHFDAVYKAEKVSIAPLINSLSLNTTNQSLSSYRGDVNVVAQLSGELFKPTFNFQIEFPQSFYNSVDKTVAFSVEQGIQQIQKNTNELNKQVTYLIVFNSFAPYESQNASVNPFNELAYSTISGLFFGEVNKRLNQLLSKILSNNTISVNFTDSIYNKDLINSNSKNILPNQSALNLTIGKSLFKERILLTLGGSFDVPLGADFQQNAELYKDVTVEFLINKSGSVRATIFYRETPDLVTGAGPIGSLRTQRTGANISYHKEFSSLSEVLFGRKKGKRKAASLQTDSTSAAGSN